MRIMVISFGKKLFGKNQYRSVDDICLGKNWRPDKEILTCMRKKKIKMEKGEHKEKES